jgi:segregation and condensation protein A
MPDYKVHLDTYSGPLDLLLYLIRRDEVDIYDIPIARVLEQYLEFVRMLEQIDPDVVGDFLVMAATLMEIKSRLLLPKPPPEVDDGEEFDPRSDLVRQLLMYKAYRDAAGALADRADTHARRFARPKVHLQLPDAEPEFDLEEVQVWDLLNAFNKLLAAVGKQKVTHNVVYDDTPITLHAADILDRLEREGPSIRFETIFEGRTRGEMVGLFLAMLELIRQDRIRVEQEQQFGSITVHLLDATPITTVLDSPDAKGFKDVSRDDEEDEEPAELEETVEDAPFEEEVGAGREAVFEDEEIEEEDEFTRRINAVQVQDIDLGREDDDEPEDQA